MQQYGLLQQLQLASTTLETVGPESLNHKDVWPLNASDVAGLLITAVTLFIAAGGGIGGGGVLVPLYIIVLHFQTEHAVALSNLTIAGSSLANLVCNISRRHPFVNRPLIDWDLILVMEPMTILGAVFGGFLNKMLPVWLTSVLLFLLLLVMAHKLWAKATAMFNSETARSYSSLLSDLDGAEGQGASDSADAALLSPTTASLPNKAIAERIQAEAASAGPVDPLFLEAQGMLARESVQVPADKFALLVALFLWLLATDSAKDAVRCGGTTYWALVLSIAPVTLAILAAARAYLLHKARLKDEIGLVPEHGDIRWTAGTTLAYPAVCSCAGLIAGMFGVGGGIVKGPLMLHLGVLPEVAAATSATMILFTTGAASVVYMTFGGIKWDYAALLMALGFAVTLAGQVLTYHIIRRLGRRSVIICAMATLLSMGALIMAYESTLAVLRARERDGFFYTDSICR